MSLRPAPIDQARRSRRLLAICLGTIFICAFLASLIQRGGGSVQVAAIVLPTQNGQWLAADLFRPRSATAETPAPAIVVVPGFQRSKESLNNLSLELARRGFVVITIDPYAQGNSSASLSLRAATTEGYGLFAVVDYLADTRNVNYVDRARIGATGHSAGGNAAILAASYFGREAQRTGKPSKLHSVFVSGYLLSFTKNILRHVRSNVGTSYALYDEGAYRNELKNGDLRRAPEALRLVNLAAATHGGEPMTEIEPGRFYGDVAARTLRVLHNEHLIHPFQPYSVEATAHQVAFFEHVFDWQSGLSPSDQVWYWKELLTFVCLIAAFVSLVPLTRLLIEHVDFFRDVAQRAHTPPAHSQHPAVFWGLLLLGATIACVSYVPMTELSQRLFVEASNRAQTWFFPQRMNNAVMLWALLNGVVGFGLFWLGRKLHSRGASAGFELARAVRLSPGVLGRTVVLAFTLFAAFFTLLFAVYYFFHVDYRFLWIGARAFDPALFGLLAMYVPAFLPFFLANSLRVNGAICTADRPEWLNLLLAALANSLGLLLIVAIQYVTFAATGTVYWTDGWLYINLLFAVVPIMAVLPIFNRSFFLLTGRIYLGPLTMCLVFIMILVSNTVCYLPF